MVSMLSNDRILLSHGLRVREINGVDSFVPDETKYDELLYDYNNNRYFTRSQLEENKYLQKEIDNMKQDKKKKLEHIIGYYYKR